MLVKISILLCCLLTLQVVSRDAENGIFVAIDGMRPDKGQVICWLHISPESFPGDDKKAIPHSKSLITSRSGDCLFFGIQPGTCAISMFDDENSNGRLDTNFLGIPREGVTASNNAKGHFGPPPFLDASIAYPGGHLYLRIVIPYL